MEPRHSDLKFLKEFLKEQVYEVHLKEGSSSLWEIQTLHIYKINLEEAQILKERCKSLKKVIIVNKCSPGVLKLLGECQLFTDLSINLSGNAICDNLDHFLKLKRLHIFDSRQNCQNDFVLELAKKVPLLESLSILQRISESRILALKGLDYLREVSFKYVKFSLDEVRMLGATLPYLTSLSFAGCNLTDEYLKIISENIMALSRFSISDNQQVSIQGMNWLKRYEASMKSLSVYWMGNISKTELYEFFPTFKGLTQLRVLCFLISDQINQMFRHMNNLESFCISGHIDFPESVSIDELVMNASNLLELDVVIFYTNKTCQLIYQNAPNIKSVSLHQGDKQSIFESGCCYLSKLRSVKNIRLDRNMIADVGIYKILRNLSHSNFRLYENKRIYSKTKRNISLLRLDSQMKIEHD